MRPSTASIVRSFTNYRRSIRFSPSSTFPIVKEGPSIGLFEILRLKEDQRSSHFEKKAPWGSAWYFATAGFIALSSTSLIAEPTSVCLQEVTINRKSEDFEVASSSKRPRVVFVLGGPGSGKGTQCSKIVDTYGFIHLSAGDLLRAEIKSGSKNGTMIEKTIKEGKIVPSEVTVKLLQKAMNESGSNKFLIDGFPRNEENRAAFEAVTGIEPEFVIFLDCTEEEMEKRLLSRNQGRVDDNMETIKKRFRVFVESSIPVLQKYEERGKVRKVNASRSIEEVFKSLQPLFVPFMEEDLLQSTKELLESIDMGDYETYKKLCAPALTAFEPEAQGHLVEGLEFHKFYFDQRMVEFPSSTWTESQISSPKISILGDEIGLITYTRLCQTGRQGDVIVKSYNETRVWKWEKDSTGKLAWKNVHFHRSKAPVD